MFFLYIAGLTRMQRWLWFGLSHQPASIRSSLDGGIDHPVPFGRADIRYGTVPYSTVPIYLRAGWARAVVDRCPASVIALADPARPFPSGP